MWRSVWLVISLLVVFAPLQAGAGAGAAGASVTIVYSGNIDGELEPCGCTLEGNLGGVLRAATTIDRLRRKTPNLFLISSGGWIANQSPQDRLTGEYLLKGVAAQRYDAIGVQWSDLAYGADFARAEKLPWVASNWHDDSFAPQRTITRGGVRLAFFTWLDPAQSPANAMLGDHSTVTDDVQPLRQALHKARRSGALTVLTTTLQAEAMQRLLPLEDVDILVQRSNYEQYREPQRLGKTLVLTPGSRGMRIARLDLQRDAAGRIVSWRQQVIPMPPSVPDAKRLKPWYAEYNAKVKESYLRRVELRKAQQSGESPYAGAETCKTCHATQHEVWQGSRHPNAYASLEKVNKAFDPNCLECHTVGFNGKGGFIDIDTTPDLLGVQCESCHGAARDHARSAGAKPTANKGWVSVQRCAQCHTQPHSPSFDFERYWPKIRHGVGSP